MMPRTTNTARVPSSTKALVFITASRLFLVSFQVLVERDPRPVAGTSLVSLSEVLLKVLQPQLEITSVVQRHYGRNGMCRWRAEVQIGCRVLILLKERR